MKKKGFTLIELMFVVSIIGILMSIAVPKFQELVSKSKARSAPQKINSESKYSIR